MNCESKQNFAIRMVSISVVRIWLVTELRIRLLGRMTPKIDCFLIPEFVKPISKTVGTRWLHADSLFSVLEHRLNDF